jgi:plastocyanin
MRKLLLGLIAVASLAAAGVAVNGARSAATSSQTVTISKTGYKPTSVSIAAGDAVVFSNSDTVAHTVTFKQATGFHCDAVVPLVIAPSNSASCTFVSSGRFNFSDPLNKGKNFHGTITVAPPPTATIGANPRAVVFGNKTTLAGALVDKQSGVSIQILETQCGTSNSTTLTTLKSTTGGAFTYQAQPLRQTAYTARVKSSDSLAAIVKVTPRLRLGKVARHKYAVHVFAGVSFAGKVATFQRYRPAAKRWVTVKRVVLQADATGVAPTVVTSASFRSGIRAKQRVRVTLGARQVGACYLAGRSNGIRS